MFMEGTYNSETIFPHKDNYGISKNFKACFEEILKMFQRSIMFWEIATRKLNDVLSDSKML